MAEGGSKKRGAPGHARTRRREPTELRPPMGGVSTIFLKRYVMISLRWGAHFRARPSPRAWPRDLEIYVGSRISIIRGPEPDSAASTVRGSWPKNRKVLPRSLPTSSDCSIDEVISTFYFHGFGSKKKTYGIFVEILDFLGKSSPGCCRYLANAADPHAFFSKFSIDIW